MGLFDFFSKKNPPQKSVSHSFDELILFYHEDDYRQVEIVASENLSSIKAQLEKIDNQSKENFNGSGFKEIYVRNNEQKTPLNQRSIAPIELDKVLNSLGFEKTTSVQTGYGQHHREVHIDCVAFGKGHGAVFYDFKDNVVEHIWFTNHRSMDKERLTEVLHDLGNSWNLILQDWESSATIHLKDKTAIKQYLNGHV